MVLFLVRKINHIDTTQHEQMDMKVRERTSELMEVNKMLNDEIREKLKIRKAIESERKRFNDLLEIMPAYIILLSPDYRVPYANKFFRERFGESQGRRCYEYLFNRTEPCEVCETYKALSENRTIEWEWTGPDKRIYSIYDFPFTDPDGSPMIMEMGIDITDLKKAQAELEKLNAELEQRIAVRTKELSKVNRTLNAIGKSNKVMMRAKGEQQYIEEVCKVIVEDCAYAMVWVGFALDDPDKTVSPVAYSGFEEGYIENLKISWADTARGRGPTGTAIRTGKPSICTNMQTDPGFEPWREDAIKRGYASSIVLPLKNGKNVFGALSIYSKETEPFSDDEIRLLSEIAIDISYGINYIRLAESEKRAVALIRESEEKYRLLFESMTEGFAFHEIITDKKGHASDYRFLSINPAFEKLTGLKSADLLGKTVIEVLPGTEKYWIEKYGEVALTGKSIEFEDYSAELNKHFKVNAFSPKKGYFAVIFENISDRKKAEKELTNTKNYLENLIGYANAPIIVWDVHKRIRVFNQAFENLTGYLSAEVLGEKLDILFPLDTVRDSNAKIRQAISSNWRTVEIPILTKEKKIRTVLWNSANILDPETGKIVSTIAQGNDITERILAEEQMKISGEKLRLALQNGNIGTWEWDLQSNRIEWDERMETIFGFEPGFFGGTFNAFEKCLAEEDINHFRKAVKDAVENKIPFETVYRIRKNGSMNYISTKASIDRNEYGNPIRMSGVCFDITDMKKGAERTLFRLNEDLLRSNRELEQFAYVASHDLQEPLRMVSSFTQLLALKYQSKLDSDAREYISYAVDGAVRMQNLINDLLEFSRIETKGKVLQPVDMNNPLRQAVNNLKIIISEKDARVSSDDLPVLIADESQIVQLFQNLIGNALKFCKTSPRVHVSATEEADHFRFVVEDNGIGIEEQYFSKIFRIFQRLMPKTQYNGTGIGLAICKRIVERHGGNIWVESEPENGSRFLFTIPKND
jgi:PAS domain S-box-containing protein